VSAHGGRISDPKANPRTSRRRRRTPPGAPPGTLIVDPAAAAPQIQLIAFGPDGVEQHAVRSVAEISELYGRQPVTWINVEGLGSVELIEALGERFKLHRLALEDVLNVHQRPKVEEYDDHVFIVTRIPHVVDGVLVTEQVTIFLGKDYVLTFQQGLPGDCFASLRQRILDARGRFRRMGADYLAYALLDAATDAYFPVLEAYGEQIERLEDDVIETADPSTVPRIHGVKRDLLTMRRAVWPQREMLNQMVRDDNPLIGDQTRVYLRDCFDHTFQLMDLIETYREIVSDLIDVFLSSVNARLNEVMKLLTIMTTIFMPLTVITGIYGMNFSPDAAPWSMPELRWAYGYPAALLLMLVVAGIMLLWFRSKGWIGRRARNGLVDRK